MRILGLLLTALVSAFLIVPVALSALAGVTANWFLGVSGGLTTRWVERVWELYAHTIGLSLLIAACCLLCTLLIGVPAAYALSRSEGRGARLVEELLTLPIAVPASPPRSA
jgi:putative spermidine/putrescine transport system permease protein